MICGGYGTQMTEIRRKIFGTDLIRGSLKFVVLIVLSASATMSVFQSHS